MCKLCHESKCPSPFVGLKNEKLISLIAGLRLPRLHEPSDPRPESWLSRQWVWTIWIAMWDGDPKTHVSNVGWNLDHIKLFPILSIVHRTNIPQNLYICYLKGKYSPVHTASGPPMHI